MIDKETFDNILTPMLKCVGNIVILQKMGLLETMEFIRLENVTTGERK